MAIECVHIYKYGSSTGLDIPLRDYSESQLAITNIEGVAPVSATVNLTQYAAKDGAIFNSARRGERHISITMKLFSNPSMDAVRQKVYNIAPVESAVTLIFDWSDGVSKAIDGYVEDTPADYFGDQEGIQINVVCPNPDFRTVSKTIDETTGKEIYKDVINYKLINTDGKQIILDIGNDLSIEWAGFVRDESEKYLINQIFSIKNNTSNPQSFLFAWATYAGSIKELLIKFYDADFDFINKEVNEYVDGLTDAVWEEGLYFIEEDDGYTEIESELYFNYLTKMFSALTEAVEFEEGKYYKKTGAPVTGQWIFVDWDNANYSDETDSTKYPYMVTYGFLNGNTASGSITNSIVSIFDIEANYSYFTSAAKAFSVLSSTGTKLTAAATFEEGIYYKLLRTYSYINGHGGWTPVLDTDDIYFYEENILPYLENQSDLENSDVNTSVGLYGFYRTEKVYIVSGESWVSNKYYYLLNGVETLTTSKPTDWSSGTSKYYSKVDAFYEMTNFTDNSRFGGRIIYDVLLDYMTYKYETVDEDTAYESGVYYGYSGLATTLLKDIYGFKSIPIYYKVSGTKPDDWGVSGLYYRRIRKNASERDEVLYYNDHVYSSISNRSVHEYQILSEDPGDMDTNYANYYTLENDFSNIIAYFTPDEYPNYSKEYSLLAEDPGDMDTNYANYYICERDFSMLLKKSGTIESILLPDVSDNYIKSKISLIANDDGETNYLLGNINGNIETYAYKSITDVYYSGGYYIYDSSIAKYVVITDDNPPEDFYSSSYKYFIKKVSKANYIPNMVIVFYNPSTKLLEYDIDNYELFLNDFKTWADYAMSDILYYYDSDTGNRKNIRKDGFTTYFASGIDLFSGLFELQIGDNYVLRTIKTLANADRYYNFRDLIGIASKIV